MFPQRPRKNMGPRGLIRTSATRRFPHNSHGIVASLDLSSSAASSQRGAATITPPTFSGADAVPFGAVPPAVIDISSPTPVSVFFGAACRPAPRNRAHSSHGSGPRAPRRGAGHIGRLAGVRSGPRGCRVRPPRSSWRCMWCSLVGVPASTSVTAAC